MAGGKHGAYTMNLCSFPSWAIKMTLRLEVQMSLASFRALRDPGEAGWTGGTWYVLIHRN